MPTNTALLLNYLRGPKKTYKIALMVTTKENGRVSKGEPTNPKEPNLQTTVDWVRKDLEAAHYLLGLILNTPRLRDEITQIMGQKIFDYAQATKGAKIDEQPQ